MKGSGMKSSVRSVWFTVAAIALVSMQVDAQEKASAPKKTIRVLFVGNSQIFYNDLPRLVEVLSESAAPDRPRISAERAVAGGASLESHWNRGEGAGTPRAKIAAEKWDY